jgi:hypothetical protein
MALQEKEFVVKNGLDVANSKIKLSGSAGSAQQVIGNNAGNTAAEWKTISSGAGITITNPTSNTILISTTGTLPANVTAVGNLKVGVAATWSGNGTTTTITYNNHGLVNGNAVTIYFSTGTNKPPTALYTVSNAATNTFDITHASSGGAGTGAALIGGEVTTERLLSIGEAVTQTTALNVKAFDSSIATILNLKDSSAVSKFSVDTSGNTLVAGTLGVTGNLTLSGAANSAASATWSNLGAVTTVDINGGTVDGTNIGVSVRGSGAFTTLASNGATTFTAGTASTTTTTGTLVVTGGVGISGALHVGSTINKVTITQPATGSTLTITDGKTLASSNTITLAAGADGQTFTFPAATTTVAGLGTSQTFTNTNTYTVNSASPAITVTNAGAGKGLSIDDMDVSAGITLTGSSSNLAIGSNFVSNAAADGGLSLDASNNATFSADVTISGGDLTISGTPTLVATTVGNAVNIFATSTSTVNIATSSTGTINIGSATSTVDCGGFLQHSGLSMSAGNNVDQTVAFTSGSIILNQTTWTDSGISGTTQLTTNGLYVFKLQVAASNEWYMGVMPWYSGNGVATLGDEYTEIPLTKYSDGNEAGVVYARILRVSSAAPKIQLSANATRSTQTYTFTFRKLMA